MRKCLNCKGPSGLTESFLSPIIFGAQGPVFCSNECTKAYWCKFWDTLKKRDQESLRAALAKIEDKDLE